MRNVEAHLLEDKMDEAVTHYMNSHQPPESVHVDANSLALNAQEDAGGRVVTLMHPQSFSSQMCRQVSLGEPVGEGTWVEELLDHEGRLAALVAHLSRSSHHSHPGHHKISSVRGDVDASVILDTPMRLFNGQHLDQHSESIVVQVPPLPSLPPLQDMKRCPDTDWFNKDKTSLKDESQILSEQDSQVLEMAGASPAQSKQNRKSLPHKKRISRKLKRTNGSCTPQQDIVVINCSEEVPQEEILPDSFVTGVPHPDHLPADAHHMAQEMRALLICQLCGEFYGDEQLKFYQHLKQHYEPHATIIIENPVPVPDLGIDKMTNTCIVDNVSNLPDSIVELSLENTVPKTMYQPIDKHILYTSSEKTLNYTGSKVQYSVSSMDKEVPESDKADMYEPLDKLENMYFCTKCNKSFRKQKQCEVHIKEAHSNTKLDDMGEFSEPEDLMEGIHVAVDESGEPYEQTLLPHLTVENGHVHQEHVRTWYLRNGGSPGAVSPLCGCGGAGYCPACTHPSPPPLHPSIHPPSIAPQNHPANTSQATPPQSSHVSQTSQTQPIIHTTSPPTSLVSSHQTSHQTSHVVTHQQQQTGNGQRPIEAKEEALQRIFETNEEPSESFPENEILGIPSELDIKEEAGKGKSEKKKPKSFECPHCRRIFQHRNSLLYHVLMHSEKQQVCRECGKSFYTASALKIHKRVHSDDRPCKCDECGREFRQWSDLKYHKASIHSNKKNFKCEFCDKEFARRYSLNVHRRIHTGERNYKCDYCNKTFRASSYRLSHMRTHTGSKPYKCTQCEKCFRVAYDLRRHMLIHDKVRVRLDEHKGKMKDIKDKKPNVAIKLEHNPKLEPKSPESEETKTETKLPTQKSILDKKQAKSKKSPKKPPNVTVQNKEGHFKINNEVFDTRQDQYILGDYKHKDTEEIIRLQERNEDRDITNLRSLKSQQICEIVDSDRLVFNRENTDGKLQIFTQIEKNKDYSGPIVGNSMSLNDIRSLEREVGREVRSDLQGEGIETVFFERLSAYCNNIPAV
ncbi:uncharacterized protein LOC112053150 [Bicyclus anynana]|uniref:Uncharacterized protein LOC112053150 n=1 Tax=Bicyclus anynana TaxID=110368 RepID=A0ABM3LFX1_BICAN|nr:uncharacterized protein LOC112053150 [Bicyclus anynana]